jgi:GDPmannose 4,6-dehydratase
VGDASKAKRKLGWAPKITFAELVTEMVAAELVSMKREAALRDRIVIE